MPHEAWPGRRVRLPAAFHPFPPLIAVLAVIVFILGCTAAGDPAADPAAPTSPAVESNAGDPASPTGHYTIWYSWTGDDQEALREMLDRLRADNPRLMIDSYYIDSDLLIHQLVNAILTGEGPSLVLAPAARYPELNAEGLVAPFNSTVPDLDFSTFDSPALLGLIRDEKLVGLPIWSESVALYVNNSLMPPSRMPSTLDELLTQAFDAQIPQLGLYQSLFHLAWGFYAHGGVFFDAGGRMVLDQSPGAPLFLDWLRQADDAQGIWITADYEELKTAFRTGNLPMFIDGPWSLREFEEALGQSLRVHRIPPGPEGASQPWLTTEAAFLVAGQSAERRAVSSRLALQLTAMEDILTATAYRIPATQRGADLGSEPMRQMRALQPLTQHMRHGPEMESVWRLGHEMMEQTFSTDRDAAELVAQFSLLVNEENPR